MVGQALKPLKVTFQGDRLDSLLLQTATGVQAGEIAKSQWYSPFSLWTMSFRDMATCTPGGYLT